jgi:hypothetical protein
VFVRDYVELGCIPCGKLLYWRERIETAAGFDETGTTLGFLERTRSPVQYNSLFYVGIFVEANTYVWQKWSFLE